MNFALVFIAHDLRPSHIALIESWCDDHHIRFSINPRWLSLHKAVEVLIDDTPRPEQWASLKDLLRPHQIDVLLTPLEHRQKKLLLADMDSTIVTTETLDEISQAVGLKDRITAITTRAMNGELDFHTALMERVSLLKDVTVDTLNDTLRATRLHDGAMELVQTTTHFGGTCILLSNGFTHFTMGIADIVGFHHHHGNQFEIENGKLTGRVIEPIQDKASKVKFLNEYKSKMSLTNAQILAVGDGANDIPMLQEAGIGVGFYPKPIVKQSIQNIIEFTDLKSLLYLQGYDDNHIHHALHSTCRGHAH
jgi:phosphoserine phosphatase